MVLIQNSIMKLLAYVFIPLIWLSLAESESLQDDVTNASSEVADYYDVKHAAGSNCDRQTNQSECTNTHEGNECSVCRPRSLYICVDGEFALVTLDESVVYQFLRVFLYIAFSISLVACIIANVMYIITRSGLKGSPYHIHWNLIASFTIYHVVFLIGYSILPSCYVTNMHFRNFLNVLLAYSVLANFFWMLVEGLILFCIVVKRFFQEQKGRKFIKWCLLGWGTPAVLVSIWIVIERLSLTEECMILELKVSGASAAGIACLVVPVFTLLVVNAIVLITVIRNISKKLKSLERRDEQKRHRRTAKSTLVLLVLLGSYYALPIPIALIGQPCLLVVIVFNVCNVISSVQGLAVSTLYVFCNGEVRRVLRKRFGRLDTNFKFVTGTTRLNSPSSSKRNSSSSGSEGRHARRGNNSLVPEAVEMITTPGSPHHREDENSSKPDQAVGGEDGRIIVAVHGAAVAPDGGATADLHDGKKSSRAGSGYSKLDTTDPDGGQGLS